MKRLLLVIPIVILFLSSCQKPMVGYCYRIDELRQDSTEWKSVFGKGMNSKSFVTEKQSRDKDALDEYVLKNIWVSQKNVVQYRIDTSWISVEFIY